MVEREKPGMDEGSQLEFSDRWNSLFYRRGAQVGPLESAAAAYDILSAGIPTREEWEAGHYGVAYRKNEAGGPLTFPSQSNPDPDKPPEPRPTTLHVSPAEEPSAPPQESAVGGGRPLSDRSLSESLDCLLLLDAQLPPSAGHPRETRTSDAERRMADPVRIRPGSRFQFHGLTFSLDRIEMQDALHHEPRLQLGLSAAFPCLDANLLANEEKQAASTSAQALQERRELLARELAHLERLAVLPDALRPTAIERLCSAVPRPGGVLLRLLYAMMGAQLCYLAC